MIRAKVTCVSSDRDDAITYLYNRLDSKDWVDWKRSGDINLIEKRMPFKAPQWQAWTTMIRDEDLR